MYICMYTNTYALLSKSDMCVHMCVYMCCGYVYMCCVYVYVDVCTNIHVCLTFSIRGLEDTLKTRSSDTKHNIYVARLPH